MTKRYAARRTSKSVRFSRILLVSLFFVVLIGASFGAYRYFGFSLGSGGISGRFADIKNWMATRKVRIHQQVAKVKEFAAHENQSPPEVHFEFYTALPNMQVEPSVTDTTQITPVKPVVGRNKEGKTQQIKKAFDAEELEKEFSQQLALKKKVND